MWFSTMVVLVLYYVFECAKYYSTLYKGMVKNVNIMHEDLINHGYFLTCLH